jgi:hypothetical protein
MLDVLFQFALLVAAVAMAHGAPAAATPEAEAAEAVEQPEDTPKDKRGIVTVGYGYAGYPAYATYGYGYAYPTYHTAYPGYAYHYPYSYYVG